MNPTTPIVPVRDLRVPNGPGERQRRDRGAADAFRRALQQEAAERPPEPAAVTPLPSALQPQAAPGRREPGATAHHVDVVA